MCPPDGLDFYRRCYQNSPRRRKTKQGQRLNRLPFQLSIPWVRTLHQPPSSRKNNAQDLTRGFALRICSRNWTGSAISLPDYRIRGIVLLLLDFEARSIDVPSIWHPRWMPTAVCPGKKMEDTSRGWV